VGRARRGTRTATRRSRPAPDAAMDCRVSGPFICIRPGIQGACLATSSLAASSPRRSGHRRICRRTGHAWMRARKRILEVARHYLDRRGRANRRHRSCSRESTSETCIRTSGIHGRDRGAGRTRTNSAYGFPQRRVKRRHLGSQRPASSESLISMSRITSSASLRPRARRRPSAST